ncbi:hypothetical protein SAMN05216480_11424 [Pustulibacterium marinum]|uniref:Uncharacterized protein n=1 Tax=Pustulibacterium marinum TaxID=1224947 RepID=A0A1I7I9V1_9FLAO|nr:hypothetical protein [Pustulibacterium marinum]SFU69773.1 hypothetical protein SAMN05216480_11424 [Pustulibacterium marinum]
MEEPERIIFLIKFGKKRYLESLLNKGELYFQSIKAFNQIEKSNKEQGDENEGAIFIENFKNIKLTLNHPKHGEFKFKSVPDALTKLTQFNHNYLTCSFYAITDKDFENSNIFEVDEKMSSFGGYGLIISNPKFFVESVINYAEKENLSLQANKVTYLDLDKEGRIELNPFIKKKDHSYQKEYRMVIKNSLQDSKILYSDKLGDFGKIIPIPKDKKLPFKIEQ